MSKAPRYPRSFGALIGSMIVLVAAVVVFVGFRDFFRAAPAPDLVGAAVDWEPSVREIQTIATVVWPRDMAADWTVTSGDWDRTDPDRPQWRMGIDTPDGFVGLYQQDAPVEDLVEATIGDDTSSSEVTIDTDVADDWTRWAAPDGDVAYSTVLDPNGQDEATLVVYGTDDAEVQVLMGSLTTDPIGR